MKNLHILPTDKPSRLYFDLVTKELLLQNKRSSEPTSFPIEKKDVYITNDEKIKIGDWVTNGLSIMRANLDGQPTMDDFHPWKKIILTTDPQLIQDGVQAIDDKFLEWFVKNPSCEEVEVVKGFADDTAYGYNFLGYKIIIPKEKILLQSSIDGKVICVENKQEKIKPHLFCETPNEKCTMNYCDDNGCMNRKRKLVELEQETLEEFAERLYKKGCNISEKTALIYRRIFINSAKWQQEQDKKLYSELVDLLERLTTIYKEDSDLHQKYDKQRLNLIKQFKKK